MKGKGIKYAKLSKEIKNEIELFHNELGGKGINLEEAMFKWFDERFDDWIHSKYGNKEKKDKRKFFRIEIEIPVMIVDTLIESSKDESQAIDFAGTILNISRGGLYFRSKNYIEVSSIIMVKIDLSSLDKELSSIEALAMVIRCDKLNDEEYGIGVMFSSIYDDHKENLNLFILKNIAHHIIY